MTATTTAAPAPELEGRVVVLVDDGLPTDETVALFAPEWFRGVG